MNYRRSRLRNEVKDTFFSVLWAGFFAIVIRSFLFEPFHIPSDSMIPGLFVGDHLIVSKLSYGYSNHSFPLSPPIIKNRIFTSEPKVGDVVVFKKIKNKPDNYIKRLIGKAGDKIQMKNGILHINGQPMKREFIEKFYIVNLPYKLRKIDTLPITNDKGQVLTVIDTKKLFINGKPLKKSQYTIVYKEKTEGEAFELNKYKQTLYNGKSFEIIELSDKEFADNTEEFIVPEEHYFMMGDNRDMSEDSRFLNDVGYIHKRDLIGRADMLFFSHNNSVSIFEVWKWFAPVRWERLFKIIK